MKRSRFQEEAIPMAPRQAEASTLVDEISWLLNASSETCFRCKKLHGEQGASHLREVRKLRDDHRQLKRLVAVLKLD